MIKTHTKEITMKIDENIYYNAAILVRTEACIVGNMYACNAISVELNDYDNGVLSFVYKDLYQSLLQPDLDCAETGWYGCDVGSTNSFREAQLARHLGLLLMYEILKGES